MKITNIGNGKIAVDTPYNPEFVRKIKAAGAKWDGERKAWITDERSIEAVRAIMTEVYGQDDRPQELVSVRVRIRDEEDVWADRGPVTLFGRVIGSAFGRDSGARLGDGVCFESGKVTSGGSMKNWDTRIKAGSVLTIYDVPRRAVEEKIDWNDDYGTFEIIESGDPLAGLKAEREALLARLAEIDAILAAANAV